MPAVAASQPAGQSEQPNWQRPGVHEQDLAREDGVRRQRDVLLDRRVAIELERRPAVGGLPDDVRDPERECDRQSEPDPTLCEVPACMGEQESDTGRRSEHSDRVLVLEAESGHEPEDEPEPRPVPELDLDQDPAACEPKENFEGVHRIEAEKDLEDRRRERCAAGHGLSEATGAETPRQQADTQDQERTGERRREPQRQETFPENGAR